MYQFFCDSNCELWHTSVKELGLNVIRMPYVLNDEEYFYDMGEQTDFQAFFNAMRAGAVPKTAALNEFAYTEYFEPVLARGEDIYYVTFSHQMSGTFSAMYNAIDALLKKYPERTIRIKDTKSICLGCGFIVYYAALKYKQGATMDELDAYLDELIPHATMYFMVEDLTYLYRGGRISGTSKVAGNLLGLKPVVYVNSEGKLVTVAKPKGTKKGLATLRGYLKQKGKEIDKYKIFVIHADSLPAAQSFADGLREEFAGIDVEIQPIGPVIGSHCGPGTIGIIFHCNER